MESQRRQAMAARSLVEEWSEAFLAGMNCPLILCQLHSALALFDEPTEEGVDF